MNDLAIRLTDTEGKCLYQQIYEYIRNEIRQGKLLAGEKLPSTRSLAEYLQVARSTVDFAYGQLTAEGYLEAKPCKGYFVSHVEDLFHLPEDEHKPVYADADSLRAGVLENKVEASLTTQQEKKVQYDFSPHAISLKDFPYATWKKITKSILVDANSEMFALGDAQGDLRLRETIGRYLHSSRGVNCLLSGPVQTIYLCCLKKYWGGMYPLRWRSLPINVPIRYFNLLHIR